MALITQRETGLFPSPSEIELGCSCPDWADMCKHVAAVLYGVGTRLDSQPELLFTLRSVNHGELLAHAASATHFASTANAPGEAELAADDVSAIFGIEMDDSSPATAPQSIAPAAPPLAEKPALVKQRPKKRVAQKKKPAKTSAASKKARRTKAD